MNQTDAELREQELTNAIIDAITLNRNGEPKWYWHEDQVLNIKKLITARDAAVRIDHSKASRRMSTILKSYGFSPVNDCINQLIGAATDAMGRERDQVKEEG